MQESLTGEFTSQTIGESVAADFRAARIFKNQGIDFCYGGKSALAELCAEKGLDIAIITNERLKMGKS